MPPAAPAPLLGLLLLLGLQGVLQTRTGRCSGDLCAFRALLDFNAAETECRSSGGGLLSFSSEEQLLDRLQSLSGFSGTFWLRGPGRKSEEAAAGFQTCSSVSVGLNVSVEWKSCSELSGFLCEFGDVCSPTRSSGGGPVTYTTYSGFTVTESESFPAGTTAERREAGGGPPASKHLCSSSGWMEAPWSCEILDGGCEFGCHPENNTCTCPPGRVLHPNQVSCTEDPCARCELDCLQVGGRYECGCAEGFRLGQDGRSCVDIDECAEKDPCAAEGQQCENLQGGFRCECTEDFIWEDGACVNVSICMLCEQTCEKISGVYRCVCGRGFRVSPEDPTKCYAHCSERDCPARCQKNPEQEQKEQQQCFCPDGYVVDIRDGTATCTDIDECEHQEMCQQRCENLFGGFRCWCEEGFRLQDGFRCVSEEDPGEDGSGSSESPLPAASRPSGPLPSYVRTGSILGIAVFLLLVLVLLCFLIRHAARRCGRFELPPLKRPDINIFYLQQVTTETYKRLSVDKQLRNEQRL